MIITKQEFELIKKHRPGQEFNLKLDFGTSQCQVKVLGNKALINDEFTLDLEQSLKDKFCYMIDNEGLTKIIFFSEITNFSYKMMPTVDWPTFTISSVPMHRRKSPKQDSISKIEAIGPYGCVLDTCMGPGYTAILASKTARKVITFEKDENIFNLARINPLSRRLFESENIEIKKRDVSRGLNGFKDNYFDCIIHDPPTFTMARELFSREFYFNLKRVLSDTGKMFHYTPLYKVKRGYDFPARIEKNLKAAGFKKISYCRKAVGFICFK